MKNDSGIPVGSNDDNSEKKAASDLNEENPLRNKGNFEIIDGNGGISETVIILPDQPLLSKEVIRVDEIEKERNAGRFAQNTLRMVVGVILLILLIGVLGTVYSSLAQAEAYANVIIKLLDAAGRFITTIIGPILIYYFLRGQNNKSDKG